MFFLYLITLCSVLVGALVIVLSNNPFERIGKIVDFSDFERGPIVDARLAGASVTKTATLLGYRD
jgi:energy-converting hydrogenase Eha subunit C